MLAITGSTGFIGSYLTKSLELPKKTLVRNACGNISEEIIEGDLFNINALERLVQDSPTLVHLACSSNPRKFNNFSHDLENNLTPTLRLFEIYAQANPEGHIIYASTGGNMYNDAPRSLPKTEKDIPEPRSAYSVHKLAAENYLRLIAQSYGISATILRISNPYGIILPKERAQGLIGVAFAKLIADEPITIFDPLDSFRDYVHLEDLVSCFRKVIRKPSPKGVADIYNVSSGLGFSIVQVLKEIETKTGLKFKTEYSPASKAQKPSWSILSYEKAKNEFGWEPKISLSQGIEMMWDSYKSQNKEQILCTLKA